MAETKSEKALRIVAERRLTVQTVGDPTRPTGLIVASCRGESEAEIYLLGYDPTKHEWRCTCEANSTYKRECTHLMALKLVVVKP